MARIRLGVLHLYPLIMVRLCDDDGIFRETDGTG